MSLEEKGALVLERNALFVCLIKDFLKFSSKMDLFEAKANGVTIDPEVKYIILDGNHRFQVFTGL